MQQTADGPRSFAQRLLGIVTGSMHVFLWSRRGAVVMLKKDGLWNNLRSRMRAWRRTAEFFIAIAPGLLRSASPRHDPRQEPDPAWAREWIAGYAETDDDTPPLVDTNVPEFPVPFAQREAA